MAGTLKLDIKSLDLPSADDVVILVDDQSTPSKAVANLLGEETMAIISRAAKIEAFKGKAMGSFAVVAPEGAPYTRLIVMGVGAEAERGKCDCVLLGGAIMGKLSPARSAAILVDWPTTTGPVSGIAEIAADISLGLRMRAYRFDHHKTKTKDAEAGKPTKVTLHVTDAAATKKAVKIRDAIGSGVDIARDLVNEPPNILYPVEFARRASELSKLGVEIEILDLKAMKKLGMGALLGVGQGSANESRVVIMRWNGGKANAKPIAFVGKGVTFDTGGISIKPAQGMEDMKGDMAGAACVTGLMHALAARKAKVNAIGAIGLVENMPDGNAQRPGDIVTSMSGQTIEIINTDAEGRLVLADVLWHVQDKYQPVFMVNLATLTGAILVALASEHAGLFSNNDELSERLFAAGKATGEKVWRLPLNAEYDKMIDSKFADMKNSGGRFGGSITAAQFLQRFVNDTPWAHLDIAGTGMSSPSTEINKSWGSGWGVRLLDRLVADHYEK
jgi:leucyl aminopeptidase